MNQHDFKFSEITPSEWAEQNRIMPGNSPFPGPYTHDRTPYVREILDRLDPADPTRRIVVMKGSQMGLTEMYINALGWIIECYPSNVLLAALTDGHIKKLMTRIDEMIDSSGLSHLLKSNVKRKQNKLTGDTIFSKQFNDTGSLEAFSIQNPDAMRQISVQIMFLDDFEAAKSNNKGGSAISLYETRSDMYAEKRKVYVISSPEVKETSHIYPLYLQGDQRKWHVPCPKCGDYIVLEWESGR